MASSIHSSSANTNYEILFQYVDIGNDLRGMTDGKLWHLGSSYILFAIVISVEAHRRCWPIQNGEFQFVCFFVALMSYHARSFVVQRTNDSLFCSDSYSLASLCWHGCNRVMCSKTEASGWICHYQTTTNLENTEPWAHSMGCTSIAVVELN